MSSTVTSEKYLTNIPAHRQYAGRILEIVMDSDPAPLFGDPNAPYLERTEQAARTCLDIGLTSKILSELSRRRIVETAVLIRMTRAMRDVLGEMSFAELEPW